MSQLKIVISNVSTDHYLLVDVTALFFFKTTFFFFGGNFSLEYIDKLCIAALI